MALVSHQRKFIYLLNPRTASTATSNALRKHTNAHFVPPRNIMGDDGKVVVPRKHSTLRQLQDHGLITPEVFQTYFKFVTVRNPFDSIVSAWAKKIDDYAKLLDDPTSWVYKIPGYAEGIRKAQNSTFPEWLKSEHGEKARQGRQGSMNRNFIRDADHVLRYETLAQDFDAIRERLGVDDEFEIPISNVTSGRSEKDYRRYYDDEARQIVSRVFREEIEQLGYTF